MTETKELQNKSEIEIFKDNVRKNNPNIDKDYPNWDAKKIDDGIFAGTLDGKNLIGYWDKDGNSILSLTIVRENKYDLNTKDKGEKELLLYISGQAGYIEIEEKGVYNMYSVTLSPWETGKFKLGNKVDIFSKEYYEAWVNILFCFSRVALKTYLFNPKDKVDDAAMDSFLGKKNIRIKDLKILQERKQVTNRQFNDAMELFKGKNSLLLAQIGDSNFDKVNDPVTIKELEGYYKEGYINKELLKLCIDKMLELGKINKKIADEIKKEFGLEFSSLKDQILSA